MTEEPEDNSVIDFEKVCRTCLSAVEDMKPLYEECVSNVCLVEKLMSCTFVQVCVYSYLIRNIFYVSNNSKLFFLPHDK